jgi:hypothetical protein
LIYLTDLSICFCAIPDGTPHTPFLGSSYSGDTWPRIISAARCPIIMLGALVLPPINFGMTDASATRKPATPRTFSVAGSKRGVVVMFFLILGSVIWEVLRGLWVD